MGRLMKKVSIQITRAKSEHPWLKLTGLPARQVTGNHAKTYVTLAGGTH